MEPKVTPRPDVTFAPTEPRSTPTGPRGAAFREVLAKTAVRSAEAAMQKLPGAPLMAVALRGGAGGASTLGVPLVGTAERRSGTPEGPVASGGFGGSATVTNGSPALGALGGGGVGVGGTEAAVEASLQQSEDKNLYFLRMQAEVNAQNQHFTALSNVLKAEHDTVKTAIGNIR